LINKSLDDSEKIINIDAALEQVDALVKQVDALTKAMKTKQNQIDAWKTIVKSKLTDLENRVRTLEPI
jgi:hypothetical protein